MQMTALWSHAQGLEVVRLKLLLFPAAAAGDHQRKRSTTTSTTTTTTTTFTVKYINTNILSCSAFRTKSWSLDSSPLNEQVCVFFCVLCSKPFTKSLLDRGGGTGHHRGVTGVTGVDSPGDHLSSELRLLFGDGGAEGVSSGDPVRLHCPKHRHRTDSSTTRH